MAGITGSLASDVLSDEEYRLIVALGFESDLRLIADGHWNFKDFLDVRTKDVFMNAQEGPAVEALRRILRVFNNGHHRNTEEYRQAIQF